MKLSDNFDLHEFQRSETAVRLNIEQQFYPLSSHIINNLDALAKNLLQPVRNDLGSRMHINSGYRCQELNEAVGGSETSDHMQGMAADIISRDAELLYKLALKFPHKQIILYREKNFVHLSYDPNDLRNQHWEQ
jgi:zinc D-Ala-D-Ala carboxypeptidase